MRTMRKLLAGSLVLIVGLHSVTLAQERHIVDPVALTNAVSEHVARQDTDRAALREALSRPEVRKVAAITGIDLERFGVAVGTMSGPGLQQAARAAQVVNQALVGGLSTRGAATTIIVAGAMVGMIVFILRDFDDTCFRAECYPR